MRIRLLSLKEDNARSSYVVTVVPPRSQPAGTTREAGRNSPPDCDFLANRLPDAVSNVGREGGLARKSFRAPAGLRSPPEAMRFREPVPGGFRILRAKGPRVGRRLGTGPWKRLTCCSTSGTFDGLDVPSTPDVHFVCYDPSRDTPRDRRHPSRRSGGPTLRTRFGQGIGSRASRCLPLEHRRDPRDLPLVVRTGARMGAGRRRRADGARLPADRHVASQPHRRADVVALHGFPFGAKWVPRARVPPRGGRRHEGAVRPDAREAVSRGTSRGIALAPATNLPDAYAIKDRAASLASIRSSSSGSSASACSCVHRCSSSSSEAGLIRSAASSVSCSSK